MKKITIKCDVCGKTTNVRTDKELREELNIAKHIVCQKKDCTEMYSIDIENGYIGSLHLFGGFWTIIRKATVEELQGVWRAKGVLHKGKKDN